MRSVESSSFMPSVTVDPSGIHSKSQQESFRSINDKFSNVFSPGVGCYNGKSGPYEHVINMNSNLPPQRKGKVPMYNQKDLVSLQLKCDELLSEGILGRPEDCGVSVEYCHPSFLVKKVSPQVPVERYVSTDKSGIRLIRLENPVGGIYQVLIISNAQCYLY